MHPRAEEFERRARAEHGIEIDVHEFPEGTKTAADAAEAVGCSVEEIASGIVLSADGDLVVSVTSGANRVDTAKIADLLGVDGPAVSMADAEDVKATLGWSIGGVPRSVTKRTYRCSSTRRWPASIGCGPPPGRPRPSSRSIPRGSWRSPARKRPTSASEFGIAPPFGAAGWHRDSR